VRGSRSRSCARTSETLARHRGWSGWAGRGVRGGRSSLCRGRGARGRSGRGGGQRRDGGGGGPSRTGGRGATALGRRLADHDIRPGEVAVYGGSDPRLRRPFPSFITTSGGTTVKPAHSLMRLSNTYFTSPSPGSCVYKPLLDRPWRPPTWPATTSTQGPTRPSSPPASRTSSSPGISAKPTAPTTPSMS